MKKKAIGFWELITSKEFQILPGNIAYSLCVSIIPIISIIIYLLSSLNISANVINTALLEVIPKTLIDFIKPLFSTSASANQIITIAISIFVITNGCNTIIATSNTVFNIDSNVSVKRIVKSLLLGIILVLLLAFILIVPLFGKTIINIIGIFTSFIEENETMINTLYTLAQWPVSLIVMYLTIKLIYIIAPDDRIKGKYVTKGAIFTTISWLAVTIIFSYYINHIADYNLIYGSLANVVILLFWLYILAYIFVIGLFLNRQNTEVEKKKTNTIALEEIRKKVKEKQKQE